MSLLDDMQRGLVAQTWAVRAVAERQATRRFERLSVDLLEHHATDQVVALAREAVDDERRHALRCDDVAAHFGWDPSAALLEQEATRLAPDHLNPRDALLYEMVAFCCITETINSSMLLETLGFARSPIVCDAVREILKDEVSHSRLGWAHLAAERLQGRGEFLSKELVGMFKEIGLSLIFDAEDRARDADVLAQYGELSFERRTEIFKAVVSDVILPGFDQAGLDTGSVRHWLQPVLADDSLFAHQEGSIG